MKRAAAGILVGAAGLLLLAQGLSAQELTVDAIVKKANNVAYYQGKDGRAKVSMTITDSQGRKRQRELTILRYDVGTDDADQKLYVYFHRPADVNKMAFLVWKHVKGDDDRWLYLPALDLVKRISATEKRTSFAGSHFFYEDVSGRDTADDTHELVQTTGNYYVLKNTPKDPDTVEFSHYTMWVHRKTFLMVQVEYFDRKGEKYRVFKTEKVETLQGYPTITKSVMKDLRSGGQTELTYSDVTYDIGLPESIFTERYLRRAPRKYLR